MLPALSGISSRPSSLVHSTIAWRQRSSVSVKVRLPLAAVGSVDSPRRSAEGPRSIHGSTRARAERGSCPASGRQGAGSIAFHGRARDQARASRSSHRTVAQGFAFCAEARLRPCAMAPDTDLIEQIRAAPDLGALDADARSCARQVGDHHGEAEIAGRDGRRARALPRRRRSMPCARRSPPQSPIARPRSKPPSSIGSWRPRRFDLSLPSP